MDGSRDSFLRGTSRANRLGLRLAWSWRQYSPPSPRYTSNSAGRAQRPLNQRLAERILDVLLERPAQRPRAIAAVRAGLLQNVLGRIVGAA